ncbi:MAG: hypothetical protein IJN38_03065 [Clostridia bacterium]|nr:hypothetical protein [Clostridia bacterium]
MTAFISAFISFAIFVTSLFGSFISVEVPEDESNFTPVLRFFAASDSHVESMGDTQALRMQKALKMAYAMADSDEEYNKLDAALFAGDLTDNGREDQFLGFTVAAKSVLREETELLAVIAKSHDSSTLDKGVHAYFSGVTGEDTDIHKVINGYHFIGLSVSKTEGEHYSEYQREWLDEQLAAATAEDPTKPVFVFQHEHISNTVYGSSDFEGWGMDYFRAVLNKYPQVVNFSGHSHYPLNDPRSIWQGEFTAVGTGALYYAEFTVDDVRTYHPDGNHNVVTFWVVEVDANNRIRLRGIDMNAGEVIIEYILDNPADPANREYTPAKQAAKSAAPVFEDDADITLKVRNGKYTVEVDEAKSADGMPIVLYRAFAYSADGTLLAKTWTMPEYYIVDGEDEIVLDLGKIEGEAAKIEVVAETAYGVQSAPISVTK